MNGKKLKPKEVVKVRQRFNYKITEFKEKNLKELTSLLDTKMSSTDRKALELCYQIKLREQIKPNKDGNDSE